MSGALGAFGDWDWLQNFGNITGAADVANPGAGFTPPAYVPPPELLHDPGLPLPNPGGDAGPAPALSAAATKPDVRPLPANTTVADDQFGGRSWAQRNVWDPLHQAWNAPDDKSNALTDRQKALLGGAKDIGTALTANASKPPQLAAGGGAAAIRPAPLDAARSALTREQMLQLLRQRATLNAPWLHRRPQQQGILDG